MLFAHNSEKEDTQMTTKFPKIISGIALTTMLTLATQISVSAQSAQEQRGKEQERLVGVWDISLTGRSCATGAALSTGRVIHMFTDGGTMTEIAERANRSTGLGTWRHLGGRSYTTLHKFIEYTAAGGFNGTEVITREIELSKNGDEFTATSTIEVFDAADQLTTTGCATATATRFQ
jgi:hypothetical protein